MTNELISLIVLHFACAEISENRILTPDEAQTCSAIYQDIKIAFLPDIDRQDFQTMT